MRTLHGLHYSPWTERARWALDHYGVVYAYKEHIPLMGELSLRRKAGAKQASVPLLEDTNGAIMGSFEIAKHAERIGRGGSLFPRNRDAEIAHWNDVAERMTRVGRASVIRNLATNRDAQREALPMFLPTVLRGPLARTSSMAAKFLSRKYEVTQNVDAEVSHTLRPALEDVRAALQSKNYLLDAFTYGDLAIAAALQCVRPRDGSGLGPGTRAIWTMEALADEFEDLLMWRDAIYRKHR